jgi:mono/diheme cytochrome c family protein
MMVVATLLILIGPPASAQSPDPADIKAGAQLFRQKADCQACHG